MSGLVEYVNKTLPGNPHTWQGEGFGDVTQDWERVDPDAPPMPEGVSPDVTVERDSSDGTPGGNASREDWLAYALAQGGVEADLQDKTRDELRAKFN